MTTWENQYIKLVNTKPRHIVAERDRESPAQSRDLIAQLKPNYKELFVEIGSGSGLHLLELAKRNPQALCVGLEIRFKRAFKTGEKAERMGLLNALVIRTDARYLNEIFSPDEVDAFLVNFGPVLTKGFEALGPGVWTYETVRQPVTPESTSPARSSRARIPRRSSR
jgi:tRNA G46 methylase TrmB